MVVRLRVGYLSAFVPGDVFSPRPTPRDPPPAPPSPHSTPPRHSTPRPALHSPMVILLAAPCVALEAWAKRTIPTQGTPCRAAHWRSLGEVDVIARPGTSESVVTPTSSPAVATDVVDVGGTVDVVAKREATIQSATPTPPQHPRPVALPGGVDVAAEFGRQILSATPTPTCPASPPPRGSCNVLGRHVLPWPPPPWDEALARVKSQVPPLASQAGSLPMPERGIG